MRIPFLISEQLSESSELYGSLVHLLFDKSASIYFCHLGIHSRMHKVSSSSIKGCLTCLSKRLCNGTELINTIITIESTYDKVSLAISFNNSTKVFIMYLLYFRSVLNNIDNMPIHTRLIDHHKLNFCIRVCLYNGIKLSINDFLKLNLILVKPVEERIHRVSLLSSSTKLHNTKVLKSRHIVSVHTIAFKKSRF